ncbi:MAG: AI-2E family transporter [Pseudomonadota bacterium]
MNKTVLWPIVLACFLCAIWLCEPILLPFFISFVLAYILHPLVRKFSNNSHFHKMIVVTAIVVTIIVVSVLLLLLVVPLIYKQITLLILQIPIYKAYIQGNIIPLLVQKLQPFGPDITIKLQTLLQGSINSTLGVLAGTINNIFGYTMATIGTMLTFLLVPIILFYFLRDWPSKSLPFEDLIPVNSRPTVKHVLNKIDRLLSAYILGQSNVCLCMAIYYSIGLSIIGLNVGILLGIITGFAVIVPFIGFLVSFCSALIIGYVSFGMGPEILYIIILYIAGSVLEGSILTPKIIGDKIGLHPLWVIFAVLVGGHLFGITGLLFAIPAAGICKIFLNLGLELYKKTLYTPTVTDSVTILSPPENTDV